MKTETIQRQLDAGGLVLPDAKCDLAATEAIVARTYGAPVLGKRVVVKLSSDRLVAAEDLAMEYLGLQAESISPPLARQLRTALDFAHWALIHQPKQARFALDLVKRMKAAERKASAKPGHAWDMFAEMADELNKSVRHFLPAFWEQAARSFKTLGNLTYAGRALNKALESERVHALDVDREHRRDAVLEFSLSGCLSGKALSDYSKDLTSQFRPQEAYETYRDLLIRRTLGGMAPTGNAGTDLIRLAKAAKLDVDAEVESFLEAIISSPSMVRAPMQFWKSVQKQVGKVVQRSNSFGMWLLVHTNPQSRYDGDSMVWAWIELLEQWNVLPMLWKPSDQLPADIEIPGGRSGWIFRLAAVEASPDRRVFELLEKMAEVLKGESQAGHLDTAFQSNGWIDVDVLEACLQLGIPLSDETAKCRLEFSGWLREIQDHPWRNSQLNAIAKDSRFAPRLVEAIPELVTFKGESSKTRNSYGRKLAARRSFEAAAVDHPVIKQYWWQYLEARLSELETGGLYEFEQARSELSKCVGPGTVMEFPAFTDRMAVVDITDNLHRSFVAGVFDEYGWEQLDRHADEYPLPIARQFYDRDSDAVFPYFTYFNQGLGHIVGPNAARTPQPIVLAKDETFKNLIPIGADAILVCRNAIWETFWRWISEKPEKNKKFDFHFGYHDSLKIVELADGSWFGGTSAIKPGDDKNVGFESNWYSDGTRVWKMEAADWNWRLAEDERRPDRCREIDPQSGKSIRESLPPFFEQDLPTGASILFRNSNYLPCPVTSGASPLGSRDGKIGWRVIRRRDGACEGLGIDGRSVTIPAQQQPSNGFVAPVALMDKPASKHHWLLDTRGLVVDTETNLILLNLTSTTTEYMAGQPTKLDPIFFHLMRVRHEPSSQKLRAIDYQTTASILAAAAVEHETKKVKEDPDSPDPNRIAGKVAVATYLPEAPSRLVTGISRLAEVAAVERNALNKLIGRCREAESAISDSKESDGKPRIDVAKANDGMLQLDLQRFSSFKVYHEPLKEYDHGAHFRAVAKFLAGEALETVPATNLIWFELLKDPVAVAYQCFWKTVTNISLGDTASKRIKTAWLDALRMFADSGLLNIKDGLTLYSSDIHSRFQTNETVKKNSLEARVKSEQPLAFSEGNSRYVAYRFTGYGKDKLVVLERSLKNKPKPPKGMTVEETISISKSWSPAYMLAFVDAVEKIEAIPFPEPKDIEDAAKELDMHPIAVALTFMGNLRTTDYGQEKLTKEIRDFYNWKVKDIQVAIAQLDANPPPPNVGCELARNNPSDALGEKRSLAVRRMVMAWKIKQETTQSMPPELATVIEKTNRNYRALSSSKFSEMIFNPAGAELLRPRKATIGITKRRNNFEIIEASYEPSWGVDASHFYQQLTRSLSVTNYLLPANHELRRQIPKLIAAARGLAENPETLLPFGSSYSQFDSYGEVNLNGAIATFSSLVGNLEKGSDGVYRADDGLIVLGLVPPRVVCLLRPANLKTEAELKRIQAVAAATFEYQVSGESMIEAALGVIGIRGEAMERMVAWNQKSPVPEGKWDQDPRLSSPQVVEQVAKEKSISSESAALYLQILALPDPTNKNVCQWNEWAAKQLTTAANELVEKDLVVKAKRARAGRDVFLPGGWEALSLPNLPIESWKLPLFGYDSIEPLKGSYGEMIVCQDTVGSLFQRAWKRVTEGDPPRYEEAKVQRGRKK